MLLELVYIQRVKEATRSLWNDIETCRRGRKVMERNRRSWNLMEVSGKRKNIPYVSYVINGESGPEYSPKKGKRKLGKKEAVRDSLCRHKSGMYASFLLPIGPFGVPRVLVNIGEMPIEESKEDLVKGVPRPELKLIEVELTSSRGGALYRPV